MVEVKIDTLRPYHWQTKEAQVYIQISHIIEHIITAKSTQNADRDVSREKGSGKSFPLFLIYLLNI